MGVLTYTERGRMRGEILNIMQERGDPRAGHSRLRYIEQVLELYILNFKQSNVTGLFLRRQHKFSLFLQDHQNPLYSQTFTDHAYCSCKYGRFSNSSRGSFLRLKGGSFPKFDKNANLLVDPDFSFHIPGKTREWALRPRFIQ